MEANGEVTKVVPLCIIILRRGREKGVPVIFGENFGL